MFVLVANPKDSENANIRIPLCADANCGNSGVFPVKFRRHQKNTIILGTLDRFELLTSCELLHNVRITMLCFNHVSISCTVALIKFASSILHTKVHLKKNSDVV